MAVGLVAALWQLLVMTGMHHVLMLMMLTYLFGFSGQELETAG